jgi:hypothetical protein
MLFIRLITQSDSRPVAFALGQTFVIDGGYTTH